MKQINVNVNESTLKRNWLLTIQEGVIFHNFALSIEDVLSIRKQIDRLYLFEDNQADDIVYSIENGYIVKEKVNRIPEQDVHEYLLKYTLLLRNGDEIRGKIFVCKDDFVNTTITELTFEAILYKYNIKKEDVKSIAGEWMDM